MRRAAVLGLAAILCLGTLGLGWRTWAAPTVLRLAVGPAGSEDANLAAAAAQYLQREGGGLRLKVVVAENEVGAARVLENGGADLAVVRTDSALPARAQSVVVMHRDAAVLLAPAGRGIAAVADLAGRTVGIYRDRDANRKLLDALLAQHDIAPEVVRHVLLDSSDALATAVRSGALDAVLAVGTLTGRAVGDAVLAVSVAGEGGPPVFVPVAEADAIAQRFDVYQPLDIVRGVFGGATPRPAETVRTLGVDHLLVAAAALDDAAVSELTRLLFVMRPTLAATVPLASRMEEVDTEKASVLPVHPGALAYYNNEVETFFDRYSDAIYVGAMVLSVVASAGAGLVTSAGARRRARTLGLLDRLLQIVRAARTAGTAAELDGLERESDSILAVALGQAGSGRLDDAGISAFTLGLEQVRHAIADRRRILEGPERAGPVARPDGPLWTEAAG